MSFKLVRTKIQSFKENGAYFPNLVATHRRSKPLMSPTIKYWSTWSLSMQKVTKSRPSKFVGVQWPVVVSFVYFRQKVPLSASYFIVLISSTYLLSGAWLKVEYQARKCVLTWYCSGASWGKICHVQKFSTWEIWRKSLMCGKECTIHSVYLHFRF